MSDRYEQIAHPQLIRDLQPQDIAYVVETQAAVANYLVPPEQLPTQPDRVYGDNQSLWSTILDEQLRARLTITLQDFLLFEWFPRSPGLFHTANAQWARKEAMGNIISSPRPVDATCASAGVDEAYEKPGIQSHMYIFNPYGKLSMLKGGIGSIRLKAKTVKSSDLWFMSASSTLVAHEGFPVALPDALYQKHIDQILTQGAAHCTLIGKLQFLPDPLVTLFRDYTDVPQLYLLVEEIEPPKQPIDLKDKLPNVSVAVSFQSEYEGAPKMYASYVTFYPGVQGSFRRRVDWLEETYVEGMYKGHIVTNFDETINRFANAVFSLDKVMNNSLNLEDVESWARGMSLPGNFTLIIKNYIDARYSQGLVNQPAASVIQKFGR